MNFLETVGICGIGTIIFFTIRHYNQSQAARKLKFNEKARILIDYHPVINDEFKRYHNLQKQMISDSYNRKNDEFEYDNGYRGTIKNIFGRNYQVYNLHIDIEKLITDKIIELEKDDNEYNEIQRVINNSKQKHQKQVKNLEIKLHELNAKILKYGDVLDLILNSSDVKLSSSDIIESLSKNLNISNLEANSLFFMLCDNKSPILYEHIEKLLGPKTDKYWYSRDIVDEEIRRINMQIDNLSFKFH